MVKNAAMEVEWPASGSASLWMYSRTPCTIFGDAAGDFSPLANLTVTEVKIIGRCLGLPEMFIEKPPSDGLTDRTDEDNFGFSYEALDTYILTGSCPDDTIRSLIDRRHKANMFKLQPMPEYVF